MRGRKPKFRHVRGRDTAFQSLLGHNGGPPLPSAASWNAFCWRKAAANARKTPSREVVAIRMRRAAELGLDYKTYAAVLADGGSTPRVLVVMLSRAVVAYGPFGPQVTRDGALSLQSTVSDKLAALSVPQIVLIAPAPSGGPARDAVAAALAETVRAASWPIAAADVLPAAPPGEVAAWLCDLLTGAGLSPRSALLIGEPEPYQDLVTRARLLGLLAARRYFDLPSPAPKT